VYNGEVYSFRALREGLKAAGVPFRSDSDTEVLLHLYVRDGPDFLQALDGMFALALWDRRTRTLLLARDGLGVKPLYVAETPRGLLFASEVKALLQSPDVPRDLDLDAILYHTGYPWCPAPSRGVIRFATEAGGLRVAPWPRVYADLRTLGVRGEEAAERLMARIDGRRS
jgi:asparagine synthase (glutamine-hydrolysing)